MLETRTIRVDVTADEWRRVRVLSVRCNLTAAQVVGHAIRHYLPAAESEHSRPQPERGVRFLPLDAGEQERYDAGGVDPVYGLVPPDVLEGRS